MYGKAGAFSRGARGPPAWRGVCLSKLKAFIVYSCIFLGFLGTGIFGALYIREAGKASRCGCEGPDRQAAYYLREASREYHLSPPPSGPFGVKNAMALMGLMNKRYLHLLAYLRYQNSADKTLSPVSLDRDIKYDESFRLNMREPDLRLPRQPRLYAYEIRNRGDKAAGGPVIYKKYLWNSVPGLLRTAGFGGIRDEIDRAKAIYKFLLPYHLHDSPPMEGEGEHDLAAYLAWYGYGLCDDAAGAEAALMELAGLRSRIWSLSGHVVAEAFAGGAWRLFDPDNRIYFHAKNDRRSIYGVEELAVRRDRFDHYTSDLWGKGGLYPESHKDIFQTTRDNKISSQTPFKSGTVLDYRLRPGEKIVFTNFNWGKYYMPRFQSGPLKRYYNGYFEYPADAAQMRGGGSVVLSRAGSGLGISNESVSETGYVKLDFASPFPIVGGGVSAAVEKKAGNAWLIIFDQNGGKALSFALKEGENHFDWSNSWDTWQMSPIFAYTLGIKLLPGSQIGVSGLSVRTEFQFGRLALLDLLKGDNRFHAYFPDGSGPDQFESRVFLKY
ncbi:MAG: hypothetical protein KKH28_04765 [Elusimicrobia bacterium]|nr:hypothetical protein [Elusimicrobiota bacterium]